ncbi:MAG TPA: amino acid ABC transporter permease [Microlunatus sp.]|jgi:glutamate transport system permease protein|nr:amino acid ABC transporter permease [Microlunatus sp.]
MGEVLAGNLGELWGGIVTTLQITAVAFVGALLIGVLVAVFRVSPIPPLRAIGAVYVEVFRNIPLLSLLILTAYGLPYVGVDLSLFSTAVVCLTLVSASFACEAVRAGINGVPVGQAEAARAIGMTFGQSLSTVILPQALRTMIQPLVNIFIGVALGSSMAAAVAVPELTYTAQQIGNQTAESMLLFVISAAVYIVIALLGGATGSVLERRLAVQR